MNNTNIALRLSPEQRDRLQAAADMDKRPLAQMIRLLLDQALDARANKDLLLNALYDYPANNPLREETTERIGKLISSMARVG